MHHEQYVNVMWAQDERFIWCVSGVVLTLCFVSYKKKNSMYCYEPKYNIIWLNDKWTLNEGECKVNALWAHAECTVIANGVEWRAQGNPQWTHWERRWIHRIIGKWNISETVPFIWCIFNIHPQIHLCKSSVCNKLLLQIHNINGHLYLDDKKKVIEAWI